MTIRDALTGGVIYTAVMAGVGLATGGGANLSENAMEGAVMAAAILADETTHSMSGLDPSVASSAAMTGAWFAAMESFLRGDSRIVRNLAAGAAVSVTVDTWY